MKDNADKVMMGGIFTHLVKNLTTQDSSIWTASQIGGKRSDTRRYPYIILGKSECRPWRSVTFDGLHHRITIEVINDTDDINSVKAYCEQIINVVNGSDFDVSGHVVIEVQYEKIQFSKIRGKKGYLAHILFTVLTVLD